MARLCREVLAGEGRSVHPLFRGADQEPAPIAVSRCTAPPCVALAYTERVIPPSMRMFWPVM